MSANPFDDETATFYVLVNHEEQYSLWPTFKQVPGGWTVVFGDDGVASRQSCLDYVEENWTDMRPKSLRDRMAASAGPTKAEAAGPTRVEAAGPTGADASPS